MHQLLFGVGVVLVTLSPLAVFYALINTDLGLGISPVLSFCTGVAFILIRNLINGFENANADLYRASRDIHDLKQEIKRLREQFTP